MYLTKASQQKREKKEKVKVKKCVIPRVLFLKEKKFKET